jgi:hypothetical protein
VPFAPFGIATVSRQVPPQLFEFLYALAASQGADPTRASDTGNDPARKGEPDGEIGLVTQKDKGLWQEQTGGPTDPQPGNVPGGRRDVLRSADFNDGQLQGFFVDSGVWQVSAGTLQVAAGSLGQDAVAVFYVDDYLPIYYEVKAAVQFAKPTAGWNANAYVIFDYHGPTDFKFAGVDQSTNKLVMGRRTAAGWVYDVQGVVPGGVRYETWYHLLVVVNGSTVTVLLDGKVAFVHTYPSRLLDGEPVGLNKGMIGIGSNNARGLFDNVAVQVLPPQISYDHVETFTGGPGVFTGASQGAWDVTPADEYVGTPDPASPVAFSLVQLGGTVPHHAYVELSTKVTLAGAGVAGIVFDHYAPNDFKFAGLDLSTGRLVIGHRSPNGGWVVDASSARSLTVGTTYTLLVVLKGASVSIQVSGAFGVSWGFNSDVVDGRFGAFVRGTTATFDDFRIRSSALLSDAAPPPAPPPTPPTVSIGDAAVTEGGPGDSNTALLQLTLSAPAVGGERVTWTTGDGSAIAGQDYVAGSGTITFTAGQTTATIVVAIIGDTLFEGDEAFTITLSDPDGLSLGRAVATVTILDDDQPPPPALPTVSFATSAVTVTEGNRDWNHQVVVRLSAPSTTTVTVTLATSDGSALAGQDYKALTTTVTFTPGTTEAKVSVTIIGDRKAEGTETFTITLSAPSGAVLGTPSTMGITILDDDASSGGAKKLTAVYAPSVPTDVRLTDAELQVVAAAAVDLWAAAGADARVLATVRFRIADLEGLTLAETRGRTIVVDPTAAGHGWHTGIDTAPAPDRMDLLTVLLHELGHLLGYDHHHAGGPGDLMFETLAPGVRLGLPGAAEAGLAEVHGSGWLGLGARSRQGSSELDGHAGGDVLPLTSDAPPAGPATPWLPGVRASVEGAGGPLPFATTPGASWARRTGGVPPTPVRSPSAWELVLLLGVGDAFRRRSGAGAARPQQRPEVPSGG